MLRCSASFWIKVEAGDNVGVLLRGTKREEVERGQVFAKPLDQFHHIPSLSVRLTF